MLSESYETCCRTIEAEVATADANSTKQNKTTKHDPASKLVCQQTPETNTWNHLFFYTCVQNRGAFVDSYQDVFEAQTVLSPAASHVNTLGVKTTMEGPKRNYCLGWLRVSPTAQTAFIHVHFLRPQRMVSNNLHADFKQHKQSDLH